MNQPRTMQMSPLELERELDRLREDLEMTEMQAQSWCEENKLLRAEIDSLRAELADTKTDMLRIHNEKVDRVEEVILLRAENEQLRDAFADGECFCSDHGCTDPLPDNCPKLLPEVNRLRAENAELRGWLEAAVKEIDNPLITMHMSAILAKTAKENQQ